MYSNKGKLISLLDTTVSKLVRLKYSVNGYCECYTCGKNMDWLYEAQNGHFISRKNMSVRFDLENCRPQCQRCNMELSGNIEVYERKMRDEIGDDKVNDLIRRGNLIAKYSSADLKAAIKKYRDEYKILANEKGIKSQW